MTSRPYFEALARQVEAGGPALDKRTIKPLKPIKRLGNHAVQIRLTDAVKFRLTIEVVPAA